MDYRLALNTDEIERYINGANIVAFDIETSPDAPYIEDSRAALDPHKAHIVGISFSVREKSAIYVPLAHRTGENAVDPDGIWRMLTERLFHNADVIKVAHNLSFEAMFLYAKGIVIQPPCYDTIAASQLTLKSNYTFRTLGDSGLKTLVRELLDTDLPSFTDATGNNPFDLLDSEDAETIRYACADSDFSLRLYHLFNGWVRP